MDESKTKSSRTLDTLGKAGGASPAGNVIDLRGSAPAKPSPKPTPAPKPIVKTETKPQPDPEPNPKPEKSSLTDAVAAPVGKRRFWRSLVRFIILILVLAAVVGGAIYLYLTYYAA